MTGPPLEILFVGFDDVSLDTARALVDRMNGSGHVRVVSATVARRDADGAITTHDWTGPYDLGDVTADLAARDLLGLDERTSELLADILEPGQTILLLVVWHLWAQSIYADLAAVGGRSLAAYLVPVEHLTHAETWLSPEDGV